MMNHRDQVLNLLRLQIDNPTEVEEIEVTADEVAAKWVHPLTGGVESTNGLIYGLVQSGKTGVLTVTGAIGADEGYRTVFILTADNDALYAQTLGRVQEAFPGMDILSKDDFKDQKTFLRRVRGGSCAIVTTKNGARLKTLIENFRAGRVRGLTCLIIDDEADQASLNTRTRKDDGTRSKINGLIVDLRQFFDKNTYLQVTATPQSLFLQDPEHDFRPKFTVLSHPGADYVGGDDFFCDDSDLIREFPLNDIAALSPGAQPAPTKAIPRSLLSALDTFMVAATYKRLGNASQNCAFLCHVSTLKADHNHIVGLLHGYRTALSAGLRAKSAPVIKRLTGAYQDLTSTHPQLGNTPLKNILEAVEFYSPGIAVKLVNGETDEDVVVRAPYNLFVGGNKLGRGVTIKNLLVSYYGRNPARPQADTVLQHARMYGYRRADIGLLRLFLPEELHTVFRAIHKMEQGLRALIARNPGEEFRGVYVESSVTPTRRNVLAPGAIGVYSGGSIYNPAQVLRGAKVQGAVAKMDALVHAVDDNSYQEMPLSTVYELLQLTQSDPDASERVWDARAVIESISQLATQRKETTAYVYVDRDRKLKGRRRETQGILDGGEASRVPKDHITLFLLRVEGERVGDGAWWPQIRFPEGRYAFAFAI